MITRVCLSMWESALAFENGCVRTELMGKCGHMRECVNMCVRENERKRV